MRRILFLVCLLLTVSSHWLSAESSWSTGLREGGGGFYVVSPDQSFQFSLMGYGQILGAYYSRDYFAQGAAPDKVNYPTSFSIRRARLDTMATLYRDFEVLLEYGTPTLPLSSATHADFGLLEARLTARLYRDFLQIRVGKMVGPFSTENSKSSRGLDAVERYSLLNSLIGISALDTQTGVMLFGRLWEGRLNYYLAIFNGNGNSFGNPADNNGDKEFQAKVVVQPHSDLTIGLGYDTNYENARTLSLLDHAFVGFISREVSGRRHGYETDFEWSYRAFSLKAEAMVFKFKNNEPSSGVSPGWTGILGGYAQAAYFVDGNQSKGLQPLLRWEAARFENNPDGTASDLQSVVMGLNWYINANVRNQVNYILEIPNGASSSGGNAYTSSEIKHIVLNELQVKF